MNSTDGNDQSCFPATKSMEPINILKRLILLASASLSLQASASFSLTSAQEARIDALIAKMTLEEKIGQLNQYAGAFDPTGPVPTSDKGRKLYDALATGRVGAVLNISGAKAARATQTLAVQNSRLGIPLLFGYDVIHGHRTMFPIPLAQASSWDMEAIKSSARISAKEASASGINWVFAPMVDIARDARWGRVMEGAGEDPYLGSRIAVAQIVGLQGEKLGAVDSVAACVKHFAGYGFAEGGRDYNTVDISEQTMQNVVLPPFRAAVDAGVATVMNAFNEVGGVPATANAGLVRDLLKQNWAFQGFVVSDWGSVGELVTHGVAIDGAEAARLAIEAGCDMDMMSDAYADHLAKLVKAGRIAEDIVDEAVERILRVKMALGLFDDPYRFCDLERERREVGSTDNLAAARDMARKSIVLLKNERSLLPLSRGIKRIALIGPLAADRDTPLGNWRAIAAPDSAVSLLQGLQEAAGKNTEIVYTPGIRIELEPRKNARPLPRESDDRSEFAAAIENAKSSDVVVMALGEFYYQSGEARCRSDVGLSEIQRALLAAVFAVNPRVTVVLMNGRPIATEGWIGNATALIESWHLGSAAGNALADVLFGDYNPSGRLPISFPRRVGQMPLYYNHKGTGRPVSTTGSIFWSHYEDVANSPEFPFGFGLSYTTFDYSNLKLSATKMPPEGALRVSVQVTNTGSRPGRETVQMYIQDIVGSVTRPVRELKGFSPVNLAPGETKEVSFIITATDLAFFTARKSWEAEAGEFRVYVGGSSAAEDSASFSLR